VLVGGAEFLGWAGLGFSAELGFSTGLLSCAGIPR
jgi:hypothetical protein